MMLYVKIPITNGVLDFNWDKPPIHSYQISDKERYCEMHDDVDILPSWTIISEQEFNEYKPVVEPIPTPTLEDKINYLYYKEMGVIV